MKLTDTGRTKILKRQPSAGLQIFDGIINSLKFDLLQTKNPKEQERFSRQPRTRFSVSSLGRTARSLDRDDGIGRPAPKASLTRNTSSSHYARLRPDWSIDCCSVTIDWVMILQPVRYGRRHIIISKTYSCQSSRRQASKKVPSTSSRTTIHSVHTQRTTSIDHWLLAEQVIAPSCTSYARILFIGKPVTHRAAGAIYPICDETT